MSSVRFLLGLTILLSIFATTACSPNHIRADDLYPDDPAFRVDDEARILDTLEARQVLDVLAQYRQALVRKDFGALNRLVSQDYYDNAGTTHTTADDYGLTELREAFEVMARHAETIQYKVVVKDVVITTLRAHVDYEYEYAYQYKVGDETTWDAGVEVNRLQMAREGDLWRIVSGL
ncbi:MAG: hypothetical protein H0U74_07515 [Bradymonadaceae bacterium]|nr:hypothetical protein [Lujinxingiaceae bacterium]